jgi:hypothetical protein
MKQEIDRSGHFTLCVHKELGFSVPLWEPREKFSAEKEVSPCIEQLQTSEKN